MTDSGAKGIQGGDYESEVTESLQSLIHCSFHPQEYTGQHRSSFEAVVILTLDLANDFSE